MKLSRTSVGQALRTARDLAGLTLTDLAGVTSMTISSISRTERGERDLTFSEMVEVSRALKIEPTQFHQYAETFEQLGVAETKNKLRTLADDMRGLEKAALELVIEAQSIGIKA